MAKSAKEYEKIIDDLMEFVDGQERDKGERVRIRNDEDLRRYLKLADKYRKTTKKGGQGSPKISSALLDKLVATRRARDAIGTARGDHTAPVMVFRAPVEDKVNTLREQGREVYRYGNEQYAWKEPRRSTLGATYNVFHDVATGRFVARRNIR